MHHDPRANTAVSGIARRFLYPLILLAIFVPTYVLIFDTKLDLNGDNARYYVLGKALSLGKGYVDIHSSEAGRAANVPPGYPALIGLVLKLVSSDFAAVKIANGVFFFLSILLLFFLFKHLSTNIHLAFVGALMVLLNGHLLRYSTLMMSEVPFLFFSTLALYAFVKIKPSGNLARDPFFYLFLAALICSFYIRTAGLALLAGVALALVLGKKWKFLTVVLTSYSILILPWILREKTSPGNTYIDQLLQVNPYRPELGQVGLSDILARIFTNAQRYIVREIPNGFFNFATGDLGVIEWLVGIVITLAIVGGLFKLEQHRYAIATYLAAALGILLVWPESWFGVRFLLPIVPLLLFCLLNGTYHLLCLPLARTAIKRKPSPLFLLLFAFLSLPHLQHVHALAKYGRYPDSWQNYFDIARWVKHNTAAHSIVCCRKPFMFYLFSDRFVTTYQNTPDAGELIADLRRKGVDYLVIDNLEYTTTHRYLIPAIEKNPDKFTLVHSLKNPDTWLLEF